MNILDVLDVIPMIYREQWIKRGSNGSLHGLTKFSMENVPPNMFFLEYISRPQTAEIFFEDVLMACVFLWNANISGK